MCQKIKMDLFIYKREEKLELSHFYKNIVIMNREKDRGF